MKVGVVGAGKFGTNHIRTLHQLGQLHGVAELNEGLRAKAAEEFGCPVFATTAELIASGVEAVVIATPAHVHHPVAKEVLSAGIPCLVEKPLTLDVAEGEELVKIAKEKCVTLMVG
ncbi:MAG: Gfo/Idh/MocA family oxidoreductase, partial [bacterium]